MTISKEGDTQSLLLRQEILLLVLVMPEDEDEDGSRRMNIPSSSRKSAIVQAMSKLYNIDGSI